jgi:hypothetical protein
MLLRFQANPNYLDKEKKSPCFYAHQLDHKQIQKTFQSLFRRPKSLGIIPKKQVSVDKKESGSVIDLEKEDTGAEQK